MRQKKREVKIGNVTIGGSNPIAVQTMLNVPVEDIEGNVAQAKRCEAAGCQILRVTCPSPADAKCIEAVKNAVNIPIVADIHFDYKAALACADVGVDKIRINPGNIGDDDRVKAVVDACQQKNIPIRIGVNGGSLEKHILARYGAPTPEGYNTVGIAMNVKHVAATPIGLTVTAKATLVEQDRKKLTFKIEAHDEAGLVGEATHDRFIIESAPFLAKAEAKKAAAK